MNTHIFKSQKVQLIAISILVLGLGVGLYLVQTKQIFKPKASIDLHSAFDVSSNESGKVVNCSGGNCTTNTLNIKIRLDDPEALTE